MTPAHRLALSAAAPVVLFGAALLVVVARRGWRWTVDAFRDAMASLSFYGMRGPCRVVPGARCDWCAGRMGGRRGEVDGGLVMLPIALFCACAALLVLWSFLQGQSNACGFECREQGHDAGTFRAGEHARCVCSDEVEP